MPLSKRERVSSRTWGVVAVTAVMLLGGCGQFPPQQNGAQQPPKETVTVVQPAPQEDSESSAEQSSEEPAEQTSEESTDQESEEAAEGSSPPPEAEDGLICGAEELQVRLDPESMTKAEGQRTQLVATNISGDLCQLRGYGGLQFLDYQGNPVETRLNRLQADPPTLTLRQSDSAALDLTWDIYQSPCVAPETLQFTPPGVDRSVSAVWGLGAVCRSGLLDATAFHKVHGR